MLPGETPKESLRPPSAPHHSKGDVGAPVGAVRRSRGEPQILTRGDWDLRGAAGQGPASSIRFGKECPNPASPGGLAWSRLGSGAGKGMANLKIGGKGCLEETPRERGCAAGMGHSGASPVLGVVGSGDGAALQVLQAKSMPVPQREEGWRCRLRFGGS